ncbi:MAG TPA: hypothetical protein VK163_05700 [Opitutaceae bacterium]|nr:hypothetical protein [Opitutaceae bacterium]
MSTPAKEKASKRQPKFPTWEHPKGSGIRISEIPNRSGGQAYGVSYQIRIPAELLARPTPEKLQRSTKRAAERLAEDRFLALRKHGTEFAKIPAEAQKKAAVAWSIVEEHNRTAGVPVDFLECVKAGLRALCPTGGRKTVSEVVAELAASKQDRQEAGTLDQSTLHDFKVRGAKFEAAFGERPIGEVTHAEISDWLKKLRKNGAQFGGPLSARSVRN